MKKVRDLISISILYAVLFPSRVLAANFSNPATGFFIDLRSFGKDNTFGDLFVYIINILLTIVGVLSIAFMIYGGFQYIVSRGNEEQAEAGKKTLTNAIIGLVIVMLSYTIMVVVVNALKGRVSSAQ